MIVIINPNSTTSMTDAMLDTARKTHPTLKVTGWTSHDGPPAIQGPEDGDAAVPPLLKLVELANEKGASAIIIGCFDDTGLTEARARSRCPVIGIGQAAYHMASMLGPRFSVVTTLAVSVPILAANIQACGLGQNVARVRASGVPVLALETDAENATAQVIAEINTAVADDNVQCVVLGCAGMVHIVDTYPESNQVRLVDGVRAATSIASGF